MHSDTPFMTCINSYTFWHSSLLMSTLRYLVSYTLHDISAQNLFRSYAIMTDVCKHPLHNITPKNWQLWWLMLHILIFNTTIL